MLKKLSVALGALALVAVASQANAGASQGHHLICHFDSNDTVGEAQIVNGRGPDVCSTSTSGTGSVRKHLQKHNKDFVIDDYVSSTDSRKGDECDFASDCS